MSDGSKISWTDATWNVITGCSVLSPGCTNCYAMRLAGTRLRNHPSREGLTRQTAAGPVWTGKTRLNEQWLDQPLRWERPRMVFVCAHGDLFHESVPDEWIDRMFAVMALAPRHTFQVLTKRAGRMREYVSADRREAIEIAAEQIGRQLRWDHDVMRTAAYEALFDGPLPNVWFGVSVEDQRRADERIPDLIETPAAVRFVSVEPQLERIDISRFISTFSRTEMGLDSDPLAAVLLQEGIESGHAYARQALDWIICGAESGPNRRLFDEDWARSLRDQCAQAGTAFFFKQTIRDGRKVEMPELDGRTWTKFPA